MEFKQLEMFVAVAQLRSVSRAAERVFRTQQAVSMAITKLEDEVGQPLFYRRQRQFELTPTGELLWKYATRMLELRDEAQHVVTLRKLRLCGEKEATTETQRTLREAAEC